MEKIDTSTEAVERLLDGVTPGPWVIDGIVISHHTEPYGYPADVCLMGEPSQYPGDIPVMMQGWDANARFIAAARDLVPALLAERDALKAEVERLKAQPVTVQDAARDADLLLSAYSAVIVLHRMLRRAGLARGIAVARKIADEIVAAHPEFPGLTALRAITEGRA